MKAQNNAQNRVYYPLDDVRVVNRPDVSGSVKVHLPYLATHVFHNQKMLAICSEYCKDKTSPKGTKKNALHIIQVLCLKKYFLDLGQWFFPSSKC